MSIEMFSNACIVTADVSHISSQLPVGKSPSGASYYIFNFDVVLLFGLTELKAQIAWKKDVGALGLLSARESH